MKRQPVRSAMILLIVAISFLLGSCSTARPSAPRSSPPDVEVVQVEQKDVPIDGEWIGARDGMGNAAVEPARLNLGFTRLTSPIEGIAGMAQQQVGALVSPSSGVVTTVSTVDPIKVYFTVSEQEYLDFNRRFPTEAKREAETKRF